MSDPVRLPERERRFLGCVHVPLSAVYQLQVGLRGKRVCSHTIVNVTWVL